MILTTETRKTEMNTHTPDRSPAPFPASSAEPEAGLYFFTIHTHRHQTRLGRMTRRGMKPNALGRTVEAHWHNLPRIFAHIRLDTFTVMPDHIHGIIEIEDGAQQGLATILRTFKSFSAREINKLQHSPGDLIWRQSHDEHVLHSEAALEETRTYILNSPARRQADRQRRLNPVSCQNGGSPLSWLLPSFLALEL
jgi:putative transposase